MTCAFNESSILTCVCVALTVGGMLWTMDIPISYSLWFSYRLWWGIEIYMLNQLSTAVLDFSGV